MRHSYLKDWTAPAWRCAFWSTRPAIRSGGALRAFLDGLIRRGVRGVKLIVSDDHAGLKAARRATLPSVPWQRCQFHLQQNALAYVTRLDQRPNVGQRSRNN